MGDEQTWPVRIAAIGPVAAGTVLWRFGEQWSVTVLVKGTFELVPDAPMRLVGPEPISACDRHEHDSPNQSLCIACETAPQLGHAEVVVFGHAHAACGPDGTPTATRSEVRLGLSSGSTRLIDKTLLVVGDRSPESLAPAPFATLPLCWKRSLGGVGCPENPFGVGLGASAHALPNFLDPTDPGRRVTSLGPVPRIFPPRRSLLGAAPRRLRERDGVLEIEPGFDWEYFQCAMPDQRVRSLRGDEWLELDGLTEEHRLRTRLPGGRALGRNYGPRDPLLPDWIPLVPDLLQIYADRRRCTIVWRGGFPIDSAESAARLLLAAGLEMEEPLYWPRTAAEFEVLASPMPTAHAAASGQPSSRSPAQDPMAGGTVDASADHGAERTALPWEQPGSLPSPSHRAAGGAAVPSGSTPPAALPWERSPSSASAATPARPLTEEEKLEAWSATTPLSAADVARALAPQTTPYQIARPRPPDSTGQPVSVPGAPWSGEKLKPVSHPVGRTTVMVTPASVGPKPGVMESTPPPAENGVAMRDRERLEAAAREAAEAETAQREAEEQAAEAAAAAREAAEAEAARLKAEAEALRAAAAQRFAEEQAVARAEAERRAAEEAERRARAAGELRTGMYGAFKRKR